MNTSLRLIPTALFTAELSAGFAELLELSAVSFISARIKAVCKTAGIKLVQLSKEELKELATTAKEYILQKQYGVAYDALTTAQKTKHKDVVKDALKRLDGSDKARQAAAKTAGVTEGEISAAVPRDSVNNQPLNAAPSGDGKAALAAIDGHGRATMLTLAESLRGSSDPKAKQLAQLVLEYFQ